MDLRLTFEEAVNDDSLLGLWFHGTPIDGDRVGGLSFAQQSCLLAAYGCDLDNRERDQFGWTRLDYFYASQGHADYDDEGYITTINYPAERYNPRDYSEIWVVAGVRGGKSDRIAATAEVYEALFGGHEQFIRPGKLGYCLQVCQDLRLARESLHGIEATINSIPFMSTPAPAKTKWAGLHGERIGRRTADFIRLYNGMAIMTMPPTVKATRGYDSPLGILDEVGIWPTGEDAANVDTEVYSQVKSRQAQFEHAKIFGISSPWINSGLLYDRYKTGTQGQHVFCASCVANGVIHGCPTCKKARAGFQNLLVCHFTTASLGNPLITREWLREVRLADPLKFRRENLALFDSPAGAFLSSSLVESAVDLGIHDRPSRYDSKPGDKPLASCPIYVAAIDSGFRHDRFTFGIAHVNDAGSIELDLLKGWKPKPGEALEPVDIIKQITPILDQYRCFSAHSDQNNFESLNALCLQHGWSIERTALSKTSKLDIMGNLKQVLEQRRLRLLDHKDAVAELKNLQRKVTETNHVKISAPGKQHDDYAMCIALLAHHCIWMLPMRNEAAQEPTREQRGQAQADKKRQQALDVFDS